MMRINKTEARALLFWINLLNGKWVGGSYEKTFEAVFNRIAKYSGSPIRWVWKEEKD